MSSYLKTIENFAFFFFFFFFFLFNLMHFSITIYIYGM